MSYCSAKTFFFFCLLFITLPFFPYPSSGCQSFFLKKKKKGKFWVELFKLSHLLFYFFFCLCAHFHYFFFPFGYTFFPLRIFRVIRCSFRDAMEFLKPEFKYSVGKIPFSFLPGHMIFMYSFFFPLFQCAPLLLFFSNSSLFKKILHAENSIIFHLNCNDG